MCSYAPQDARKRHGPCAPGRSARLRLWAPPLAAAPARSGATAPAAAAALHAGPSVRACVSCQRQIGIFHMLMAQPATLQVQCRTQRLRRGCMSTQDHCDSAKKSMPLACRIGLPPLYCVFDYRDMDTMQMAAMAASLAAPRRPARTAVRRGRRRGQAEAGRAAVQAGHRVARRGRVLHVQRAVRRLAAPGLGREHRGLRAGRPGRQAAQAGWGGRGAVPQPLRLPATTGCPSWRPRAVLSGLPLPKVILLDFMASLGCCRLGRGLQGCDTGGQHSCARPRARCGQQGAACMRCQQAPCAPCSAWRPARPRACTLTRAPAPRTPCPCTGAACAPPCCGTPAACARVQEGHISASPPGAWLEPGCCPACRLPSAAAQAVA